MSPDAPGPGATRTPLFARLLGRRFVELPPTVRRLHARQGITTYHGEVTVERGAGVLARLCAVATRLPPSGRGPLAVDIVAHAAGERWTRRTGGHAMRSCLWSADGLLCERLGLVTFGFRLDVDRQGLTWRVERVRALGMPLPAAAFRRVRASEREIAGRYVFDVAAVLPLVGPLIHYRGWLDVGA